MIVKKQSLVLTGFRRQHGDMNTRNHYSHNENLAFADRDSARAAADLRALGAPEYAERAPGLLGRLLHRPRHH